MADIRALLAALQSPDPSMRKPAEAKITELECKPGFLDALHAASLPNSGLDDGMRVLAIICVKNIVTRHWRRGKLAPNSKSALKEGLVRRINDPNRLVVAQLLEILAKISRTDYPKAWPSLFNDLISQLESPHSATAARALNKVLKALATKRLQADRQLFRLLAGEMLPFFSKCWFEHQRSLIGMLASHDGNVWGAGSVSGQASANIHLSVSAGKLNAGAVSDSSVPAVYERPDVLREAEICVYTLKCLQRLLVHGKPSLSQGSLATNTLGNFHSCLSQMLGPVLGGYGGPPPPNSGGDDDDGDFDDKSSLRSRLRKIVEVMMEAVSRLRSSQPMAFLPFLPAFLEVSHQICLDYSSKLDRLGDVARRFELPVLLASRFLASALGERCYAGGDDGSSNAGAAALRAFFNQERLVSLLRVTTTRFMSLTTKDLRAWEEDPEEYLNAQDSVSMDSDLRASGEHLYLTLLEYDMKTLVPEFIRILSSFEAQLEARQQAGDKVELLELAKRLDGLWLAAGLDTFLLKEHMNYGDWFVRRVVPIISTAVSEGAGADGSGNQRAMVPAFVRVLQRRSLWLVGCLTYELPDDLYGPLYEAIARLLSTSSDVVTILGTINAFKSMIDNCGFGVRDTFTTRAGSTKGFIVALYGVLGSSTSTRGFKIASLDTCIMILNVVSTLITRHTDQHSGCHSLPGPVDEIVGPLPALWSAAVDQNLLRASILTILRDIVEAVGTGPESARVHAQVLPLVQYATDRSQKESVYLSDEGLRLWRSIVSYTQSYTEQIHVLFQNVPSMMAHDFDHAEDCMALLDTYTCIGGQQFVSAYASQLQLMFEKCVGSVDKRAALKITRAMDTMLKAFPRATPAMLATSFAKMLKAVIYDTHKQKQQQQQQQQQQQAAQAKEQGSSHLDESPVVIVAYLSLLARILLNTPALFQELISAPSTTSSIPGFSAEAIWNVLVEQWISRFDNIGGGVNAPWTRKRWTMALCVAISSGDAAAMKSFPEFVNICVSTLAGCDTEPNHGSLAVGLGSIGGTGGNGAGDSAGLSGQTSLEASAKLKLQATDPVHSGSLRDHIKSAFARCSNVLGADAFHRHTNSAGTLVMGQLRDFLQ